MDRDTITALTVLVRVYRRLKELGIYDMPVEIKGIKSKALTMRQHLERLNKAYDTFNEKAPAHAADVEAIATEVDQLNEDLSFAVNVLGNSTASSSVSPEKPKTEATATVEASPPEVGQQPTFHG